MECCHEKLFYDSRLDLFAHSITIAHVDLDSKKKEQALLNSTFHMYSFSEQGSRCQEGRP